MEWRPLRRHSIHDIDTIPVLATWHIRVRRFGVCEIALEG